MADDATSISSDRLIAFLRAQRQTREFEDEPIPEDVLRDVLDVARWTGSAMNKQPWEFVVVRDRATLRALAEAYPNAGHIARAAAAIVIVMAGERAREQYDEGRLAERILLAASARGLGAGIGWLGNDGTAEAAKGILGIPQERFVRTAVALGYATPNPARGTSGPGRKPLSELVHEERYGED